MNHAALPTFRRARVELRALPIPSRSKPFGALLRYALVGVGNTAVSFTTFVLLTASGLSAPSAAAAGFAAGALHGYLLNSRWTFRTPAGVRSGTFYVAVQALGMALTAGLVALLAVRGLNAIRADLVAMPIVTVVTYLLNARWTFASRPAVLP